jgi:hypothetical protein
MNDSESPHLRLTPAAEPAPWAPIEVVGLTDDDGVTSLALERLLRKDPGRRLTATDLLPLTRDDNPTTPVSGRCTGPARVGEVLETAAHGGLRCRPRTGQGADLCGGG